MFVFVSNIYTNCLGWFEFSPLLDGCVISLRPLISLSPTPFLQVGLDSADAEGSEGDEY